MQPPTPRGPVSAALTHALVQPPTTLPSDLHDMVAALPAGHAAARSAIDDDDLQLSLLLCYELHYRGFTGVDDRWEWEPSLLGVRRQLERRLEAGLRALVPAPEPVPPADLPRALATLVEADDGPSLAGYLQRHATIAQFREFVMHRSVYHLKEADPHTWAVPRLSGRTKAALVEIQADEYGEGVLKDMHNELFGLTMERLGLDPTYNAYVDVVPASGLATVNIISMFALHRRLLGAAVGHLALFEMASIPVMTDLDAALRRLGFDEWTRLFYATHVVADAHHQTVAAEQLAGGLVRAEPQLARDVLFGAHAVMCVENTFTGMLLDAWAAGQTALRTPEPVESVA